MGSIDEVTYTDTFRVIDCAEITNIITTTDPLKCILYDGDGSARIPAIIKIDVDKACL